MSQQSDDPDSPQREACRLQEFDMYVDLRRSTFEPWAVDRWLKNNNGALSVLRRDGALKIVSDENAPCGVSVVVSVIDTGKVVGHPPPRVSGFLSMLLADKTVIDGQVVSVEQKKRGFWCRFSAWGTNSVELVQQLRDLTH